MQQNITLKLDKDLLKSAKAYAVEMKTSLSRLMIDTLKKLLDRWQGYNQARKKALALLRKKRKLGGGPYYSSREELHRRHGR